MTPRRHRNERGRASVWLAAGAVVSAGTMSLAMLPAASATSSGPTALFAFGVLTVVGDAQDNSIVISRDAAGRSS